MPPSHFTPALFASVQRLTTEEGKLARHFDGDYKLAEIVEFQWGGGARNIIYKQAVMISFDAIYHRESPILAVE
jgi:hypothetical protein